jgi:Bacterial Ig-like domain (group 2)/Galactose oxidase, central domain
MIMFLALAWSCAAIFWEGQALVDAGSAGPPPTLVSVAINPSTVSVLPTSTKQFTAVGTYSDNSTQDITSSVAWSSSATLVASISNLGLATAISTGITTISATLSGVQNRATLAVSFAPAGSMSDRSLHTATLLNNGKVLIAGGYTGTGTPTATAELYDPVLGAFIPTSNMTSPHAGHTATLLNNGKVLIAGGSDSSGPTASAELYDPTLGTFSSTGNMKGPRLQPTATLLNNGTVLITGGLTDVPQNTAEIYDPVSGKFTPTISNMAYFRWAHVATLLSNGKVLITGGSAIEPGSLPTPAELYDPISEGFTPTGTMAGFRHWPTATRLNSGAVLIAGGNSPSGIRNAEIYDPVTEIFIPTTGSMTTNRINHTATLLSNGQVLLNGGLPGNAAAEIYDPISGMWALTGSMAGTRWRHRATLLNNGLVLITGGTPAVGPAELYLPPTLNLSNLVSISVTPTTAAVPIGTSQTFVATGTFSDSTTQALQSVTWSSSNTNVASITNDTTNRGTAFVRSGGTATIKACDGSVCNSTTLNATGIAPVAVTPASLTFPARTVGTTSGARIITVKNNLLTAMTGISIIYNNSAEFPQSATTCGPTLNPGASCTIRIKFKPNATGIRSGTLFLVDSAATSPQTVIFTGTGR